MNECGGHKDLCGSRHRSVIPYVHERTELYCSSLPYLSYFFLSAPCEEAYDRTFIAQDQTVTLRPRAQHVIL
jgi:hypothetical protein